MLDKLDGSSSDMLSNNNGSLITGRVRERHEDGYCTPAAPGGSSCFQDIFPETLLISCLSQPDPEDRRFGCRWTSNAGQMCSSRLVSSSQRINHTLSLGSHENVVWRLEIANSSPSIETFV
ncbi:uncharacterized [Tachysurus ichikawai]